MTLGQRGMEPYRTDRAVRWVMGAIGFP